VRSRRLAAVRRALGEHDRRSRRVPVTRDALAPASAAEARSVAEPWSMLVDRAANTLSRRATRRGRERRSQRSRPAANVLLIEQAFGFGSVAATTGVRTRTETSAGG
jgi:hypothetical protein